MSPFAPDYYCMVFTRKIHHKKVEHISITYESMLAEHFRDDKNGRY